MDRHQRLLVRKKIDVKLMGRAENWPLRGENGETGPFIVVYNPVEQPSTVDHFSSACITSPEQRLACPRHGVQTKNR